MLHAALPNVPVRFNICITTIWVGWKKLLRLRKVKEPEADHRPLAEGPSLAVQAGDGLFFGIIHPRRTNKTIL